MIKQTCLWIVYCVSLPMLSFSIGMFYEESTLDCCYRNSWVLALTYLAVTMTYVHFVNPMRFLALMIIASLSIEIFVRFFFHTRMKWLAPAIISVLCWIIWILVDILSGIMETEEKKEQLEEELKESNKENSSQTYSSKSPSRMSCATISPMDSLTTSPPQAKSTPRLAIPSTTITIESTSQANNSATPTTPPSTTS